MHINIDIIDIDILQIFDISNKAFCDSRAWNLFFYLCLILDIDRRKGAAVAD